MKEKHTRNSLLIVLGVALAYLVLKILGRDFLEKWQFFALFLSLIYFWFPGALALIYSNREERPIAIFTKPNRVYWLIPILTLVTFFVASFATLPFREAVTTHSLFEGKSLAMQISTGLLFFLVGYVLLTLICSLFFLGSELYWRGYLWDHLKDMGPWKAMGIIALAWGLWQFPLSTVSLFLGSSLLLKSFLIIMVISIVFTPLLIFFRVVGQSVYAAALCYSSFFAAFTLSVVLFQFATFRETGILGGWFLLVTALEVLILKLIGSKKRKNE